MGPLGTAALLARADASCSPDLWSRQHTAFPFYLQYRPTSFSPGLLKYVLEAMSSEHGLKRGKRRTSLVSRACPELVEGGQAHIRF